MKEDLCMLVYLTKRPLHLFLLTAAMLTATITYGQSQRPWEEMLTDLVTTDDMESAEWEETYEWLCDLEQHPLDINTATREQLLQLPFLNERQVEDIHTYLYYYGAMKSLGELAMIESIDYTTRNLLNWFVVCQEKKPDKKLDWHQALKYGKSQVMATADIPFYERRGDHHGYLGYQYRHSVRYKWQYGNRLKIGLVGSQDAGEPFFANKNKLGYDHYSIFAEAHQIGRVKTLVAGHYRASMGMGLVMGNLYATGKLSAMTNLSSRSKGFTAHSSRSAANYLQGCAATVNIIKGLDLSAFASYRKEDATLSKDSTQAAISTIVTDGYHRTATEMARKNNISETTVGADLSYARRGFHVGATMVHTSFDKPLHPDTTQRYRRYYPYGKQFTNVSGNYGYTNYWLNFHSETAISGNGAIATIHALNITPSPALTLTAIQRFFSKQYWAIHASTLSEGSRVQNESAVYLGAQWQPTRHIRLTAYTDYAYFAAPRYQALAASHTWDNLLQAQYSTDQTSCAIRYRLKLRQHNNATRTALTDETVQRFRMTCSHKMGKWQMGGSADMVYDKDEENSFGWMLAVHATYTHRWLSINASSGYFDTDNSASSVYCYEKGVLYSYAYRSYYGEGIKYSLSAKANIGQSLSFAAYLSVVDYFDRNHIQEGMQRIDHSSKADLSLQLRWRF